MKKLIAIITVMIMLSTSVYAEKIKYSDLSETDACYKHVDRLTDFNMISGYTDGTFRRDAPVTRAEMAKLLCLAIGETDAAEIIDKEVVFSDVPVEHWANKYILVLNGRKIVSGYGDGTYRPDYIVTYEELIKTLVCAVGYETYAEKQGDYPHGYIVMAAELGITEGIPAIQTTDTVKRGEAAILIDNVLDVPLCVVTGYAENEEGMLAPTYEIQDGDGRFYQTLLTKLGIYTVNGTVTEK